MSGRCKVDPDCDLPQIVKKLIEGLNKREEKAEESRECYRKKQDEILKKVTKMDQAVHGDKDIGHEGMLKQIQDNQKVMYIPRIMHECFQIIKKPVVIIIFGALVSALLFGKPLVKSLMAAFIK